MDNTTSDSSLAETINTILVDLYNVIISYLPQLFWALIVLLIGLLLAKWAKSLVVRAFKAINIDALIKRAGFDKFTSETGVRPKIEESIGELTRWFIIYLFLISVFNILGLTSIAEFMQSILSYVPNILAALFIFIVSVLLAGFVESFVKNSVGSIDVVTARLMGKIASYTVIVIGSLIALSELGIAEYFINILFIGFVVTLAISIGLAFGLGAKDVVNDVLKSWYKKFTKLPKKK